MEYNMLIDMLEDQHFTHKWYADGVNVAGRHESLAKLNEHGSAFGCNVVKCFLITKVEFVQKAKRPFFQIGCC